MRVSMTDSMTYLVKKQPGRTVRIKPYGGNETSGSTENFRHSMQTGENQKEEDAPTSTRDRLIETGESRKSSEASETRH